MVANVRNIDTKTLTPYFKQYSVEKKETKNQDKNNSDTSLSKLCTDGKDDGRISLIEVSKNFFKGVKNTVKTGLKSMYKDKNGRFSLLKAMVTTATAAVSIAFPVVGLAVCCLGAISGTMKIIKGIDNIIKSTNDAQTKIAWQNIGGGAFTAVVSYAGAKASYGAMKATSTAGINGGNAIDALSSDATLGARAKALLADAKSSTVNNVTSIGGKVATVYRNHKAGSGKTLALEAPKASEPIEFVEGADGVFEIKGTNPVLHTAKQAASTLKTQIGILPQRVQSIVSHINANGIQSAISEYGYAAVSEALETVSGYNLLNQAA